MMTTKELSKPYQGGYEIIKRMDLVVRHMYEGKSIRHSGFEYFMDGDFNVYTKMSGSDGEEYPIFCNDHFWGSLSEIAESVDEKDLSSYIDELDM